MARTVFVNPTYRARKRRKKATRRRRRSTALAHRTVSLPAPRRRRRNAGITPFVQNPLILSNPRRKRRRKNPITSLSLKSGVMKGLSYAGGAGVALTVNTVGISKISNDWARRGVQFATAILGGALLGAQSANLGGAFAGAMMYPLLQDLSANLLGVGVAAGAVATAKEADLDALAADLEDVMDELDDEGLSDDDDDEMDMW